MVEKFIAVFSIILLLSSAIGAYVFLDSSATYRRCLYPNAVISQRFIPPATNKMAAPLLPPSHLPRSIFCALKVADVHNGIVTALSTVILTIVTAILGWIALQQSNTTRAQLRAYIAISTKCSLVNNGKMICHFIIKNTGLTPAYDVQDETEAWVDDYPKAKDNKSLKVDSQSQLRTIGPNDDLSLLNDLEIPSNEATDIRNEKKAIWTMIKLSYKDTFGRPWHVSALFHMTGTDLDNQEDRRMSISHYKAT